jgi:hypothetical protein
MPNFDIVVYFKNQKVLPPRTELQKEADKIILAVH